MKLDLNNRTHCNRKDKTMKAFLILLLLISSQAAAQGYYDSRQQEYRQGFHQRFHSLPLRQQNATIIPRLDGGYTVMEPYGRTVVTPADSMGRVRIIRNGDTTW